MCSDCPRTPRYANRDHNAAEGPRRAKEFPEFGIPPWCRQESQVQRAGLKAETRVSKTDVQIRKTIIAMTDRSMMMVKRMIVIV